MWARAHHHRGREYRATSLSSTYVADKAKAIAEVQDLREGERGRCPLSSTRWVQGPRDLKKGPLWALQGEGAQRPQPLG